MRKRDGNREGERGRDVSYFWRIAVLRQMSLLSPAEMQKFIGYFGNDQLKYVSLELGFSSDLFGPRNFVMAYFILNYLHKYLNNIEMK